MNEERCSNYRADTANSVRETNLQAEPARLVAQIQSLIANPQSMPRALDRSPLFQVAAQLETPHPAEPASQGATITEEIFAYVRKEALKVNTDNQTEQAGSPKKPKGVTSTKTTVLLVEDHTVFRECFRKMLEAEGNMEVICEAQQGRQAVALAKELHPDLVLMDISMPLLNGFEATRQIRRQCPDTKVVIMSAHNDASYIQNAMDCGAQGFVFKQDSFSNIRQALSHILGGRVHFGSANGAHPELVSRTHGAAKGRLGTSQLTSREVEVLQLIAEGKANKQTASELGISSKTVEKHRHNLMSKLNIHDTASLTRHAIELGLIEIPVPMANK